MLFRSGFFTMYRKIKDMPLAMVREFHSIDLCHGKDEIVRMPVTMGMANDWGISVDELEQITQKNNPL